MAFPQNQPNWLHVVENKRKVVVKRKKSPNMNVFSKITHKKKLRELVTVLKNFRKHKLQESFDVLKSFKKTALSYRPSLRMMNSVSMSILSETLSNSKVIISHSLAI